MRKNIKQLADVRGRFWAETVMALVTAAALIIASAAWSATSTRSGQHSLTAAQQAQLQVRATRYQRLAVRLIAHRDARFKAAHRIVRAGDAPDPGALAALRAVAIDFASQNGVATPAAGLVYSSDHVLAEKVLTGDTVMDDDPVFSVVLYGNFIGYLAHTPDGTIPTGGILTITVDANTLEITDWSLEHVLPGSLTSLGVSTALGN